MRWWKRLEEVAPTLNDWLGARLAEFVWANHDDVALRISAKWKDMITYFDKSKFLIKTDGARVALPNAEPDLIRTLSFC